MILFSLKIGLSLFNFSFYVFLLGFDFGNLVLLFLDLEFDLIFLLSLGGKLLGNGVEFGFDLLFPFFGLLLDLLEPPTLEGLLELLEVGLLVSLLLELEVLGLFLLELHGELVVLVTHGDLEFGDVVEEPLALLDPLHLVGEVEVLLLGLGQFALHLLHLLLLLGQGRVFGVVRFFWRVSLEILTCWGAGAHLLGSFFHGGSCACGLCSARSGRCGLWWRSRWLGGCSWFGCGGSCSLGCLLHRAALGRGSRLGFKSKSSYLQPREWWLAV